MNMEADEQGKPVLESNPYPLTIGGAIGWLVRELKAYERSIDKPELKKAYNRAYRLNEQWDASETEDAREWFSQNPDQAGELEELYTLARRELAHAHHGDASFPVIDELVEIKLLPVSDKLPRKSILQRKKFADAKEAKDWLVGRMKSAPRNADETDADYLNRLLGRSPHSNPPAHKTANLVLLGPLLTELTQEAASRPTGPSRKRTVSQDIMDHIVKGQLRSDNSPTGLHTIKGQQSERVCEWYGDRVDHEYDCYWKNVRSRADTSKSKTKGSTFYPDAWTIQDIKDAIEYASQRSGKPEFEVQAPAKAPGLVLFFNGDSYYPYFGE